MTRGGLTSACCPGHWMHMRSCSGMDPICEGMQPPWARGLPRAWGHVVESSYLWRVQGMFPYRVLASLHLFCLLQQAQVTATTSP